MVCLPEHWGATVNDAVRGDFPILQTLVHGKRLTYLDNAATTQKPRQVTDSLVKYYHHQNANIHRGVHHLSEVATKAFESSRTRIAKFVGAPEKGLIFTRGTTEAINLVAHSFVRPRLKKGDEILVTEMEHHSNIVPWQLACEATGATLRFIPINDAGELDLSGLDKLLGPKTRFFSFTHISNALGTVNPVRELVKAAHEHHVPVLVDGAQAVPHAKVDFAGLGADFYAASGHKMYGPTGIGFLAAKTEHLNAMEPYQGGGDMIRSVSLKKGSTWNELPWKFEAGTPHIEGGIGLGAAVDYLMGVGMDSIAAHEHDLLVYATNRLLEIPGLHIVGTAKHKAAVISFTIQGIHPHDLGTLLDRDGVAVRTGHHCAQPVMDRYEIPATTRASFGLYNTRDDVDRLVDSLQKIVKMFGGA